MTRSKVLFPATAWPQQGHDLALVHNDEAEVVKDRSAVGFYAKREPNCVAGYDRLL